MQIDQPIFIIGAGRSGTSIFYSHLAIHPDLGWFSNYSSKMPGLSSISLVHKIIDVPIVGSVFQKNILKNRRFTLRPNEGGTIYRGCGFRDGKKSTAKDIGTIDVPRFYNAIQRHLLYSGRERFISKQTSNTQRLELITQLFEDAYYIHIIRDGRAVANSLMNVGFWQGMDIWWLSQYSEEYGERNRIELCASHWQKNVHEILKNRHLFSDRYLEIKYENFCKDFMGELLKVMDFCRLRKEEGFLERMPKSLPNRNHKWKNDLKDEQKELLNRILKKELEQLGYM